MALLRLGDAELTLYLLLVDVDDGMNQKQRLTQDNYEDQGRKSTKYDALHGLYVNT